MSKNALNEEKLSQISGGAGGAAPQRMATDYSRDYEAYCRKCEEARKNGADLLTLPFDMWKERKDNGQI